MRHSLFPALVAAIVSGACATVRPANEMAPTSLRIISTNDFHGAFESRPEDGRQLGGAAHVAAAIGIAAGECAPGCITVLLDGGDMFQGTPASNLDFGRPVVELYNYVGYAAAALGNHEFDWGQDTLRARMRQARFSILGANVAYTDGRDVPWIPDDTLIERRGVRIGIIGLTTLATPTTTRSEYVAGLRFLPLAPVVDARARALRTRGARFVIVTAHVGAFCQAEGTTQCTGEIVDLANGVTERIDAIVSGHTHSLVASRVNGIPIVQARSSGRAIGILDLPIGGGEARVSVRRVVTDSITPSEGAQAIAQRALASVAPLVSRRIADIAEPMIREGGQYALGNLIADAMRTVAAADVAIMNNGGIRANLAAGTATYGSLFEVQPFGNILYRVTVTGAQLREYFERVVLTERRGEPNVHVSGVRVRYDPSRPAGSRVISLTLADGSAPAGNATYTVVINDFMLSGGDNLAPPRGAPATSVVTDLDALISYLGMQPQPVRGNSEARIQRVTQ